MFGAEQFHNGFAMAARLYPDLNLNLPSILDEMHVSVMHADILASYFKGKLDALREAVDAHDNSGSEDGDMEAMDTSNSPQSGVIVMGSTWVHNLQQVVGYMEQLGLVVSLPGDIMLAEFVEKVRPFGAVPMACSSGNIADNMS